MKKVVLVDGNNLLFRGYYATSHNDGFMRTKDGFPTNAIYSLVNMINKVVAEEKPEYIMVAFDVGKTFRHEKFKDYKGERDKPPEELLQQFPVAKEILTYMGIKYIECAGYEADDIIGTFAKMVDNTTDMEAVIVSSDKDLLQLISDKVVVKQLKTKDSILMNRETFMDKYGIEPIRMIDLKALMGDPSDNIKGVKGIGEVGALKLLKEYKTLDNIYENIDNIKGALREKLINGKEDAYFSYELATIYKDVPIDRDFEVIKYNLADVEGLSTMYRKLEFYSLLKKLDGAVNEKRKNDIPVVVVNSLCDVKVSSWCSLYIETDCTNYHRANITHIGIYNDKCNYVYRGENLDGLNDIIPYIDAVYDYKKVYVLLYKRGYVLPENVFDISLAAYLLNYNVKDDVAVLANSLDYDIPLTRAKNKFSDEETISIVSEKTSFIFKAKKGLMDNLKESDVYELYSNVEAPLSRVLASMELEGIRVDDSILSDMKKEISDKIGVLASNIYNQAGCEFNLSSPKQVGDVLFKKLGLPHGKKNKSGYVTDISVLSKLSDDYEIVRLILEHRLLSKLYSTYLEGLSNLISEDGKIHTIYTQTLTRTGRLSSVEPNLQNIPIKSEYGRLIRKAFVAEDNSVILSSDYSQIELRVFTHFAKVDALMDAFKNDMDIHSKTAEDIFGISKDEVDKSKRRVAKAVNFGILYGISSYGLSEDLGISISEAKDFMKRYFETYPGIKEYMNREIEDAYRLGYVKTIMNRKRVITELSSSNRMIRSMGERIALNTKVQGSAADILKMAMINIDRRFREEGIRSKMLLQVHDELIFNVLCSEIEVVTGIIREEMENVYKLSVPLRVDINYGKNWYEAK